jgi:hypothetical protein
VSVAEPAGAGAPGGGIRRWLPLLVLAVFPLAALRARFGPVGDPDAFWHILAGRHVLDGGSFAGPDPFGTFTRGTWILHEWLPEVGMAWFEAHFGLPGVAWLGFVGILGIFVAVHAACRTQADPLPAVVAAVVGWVGASGSMGPRPQLVSLVLLAVTVGAWLRTVEDGRVRWWLVPLTWLWACSHGLWLAGPAVGLVVVAGLAIDSVGRRAMLRRQGWVPLASVLVGALTPVGPRLLTTPGQVSGYARFVLEWNPPSIRSPYVLATAAMLAAVVAGWARRPSRVRPHVVGLWLVALVSTLVYARTVALGAVIVAPLFADTCQRLVGARAQAGRRVERVTVGAGAAVALVVAALVARGMSGQPEGMPTGLTARLDALPRGTVVLDDYALGGWLLWREAGLRPVVDPRTELYDPGYLDRYATSLAAAPGWLGFVESTAASAAVLPAASPLGEALVQVREWRVVGEADGYRLLVAPPVK